MLIMKGCRMKKIMLACFIVCNICGNASDHHQRQALACSLYDSGALAFGSFTLKSGITSPVYIDLRLLGSHPHILAEISRAIATELQTVSCDLLCGVPLSGIPIATACALTSSIPMIMVRPSVKAYGTKKTIEGSYCQGQSCVVIEDIITSGMSSLEISEMLEKSGLVVTDIIAVIDRQQGGRERLNEQGYSVHSVFTMTELITHLLQAGKIDAQTAHAVIDYVAHTKATTNVQTQSSHKFTYGQRAQKALHPIAQKLFTIMEEKHTNLCVAADITNAQQLLQLAESIGPEICMLKLHIDIIEDFDSTLPQKLQAIAHHHNFLIFEDRKFADIGAVVQQQASKGVHHITDWADIVTVHTVAGDGTLKGIKAAQPNVGQLLLAQMSSEGTLAEGDYTKKTVALAEHNLDCVVGLICREKLSDNPAIVHLTPGVHAVVKGDTMGQQYLTPERVIKELGSDVIIVGRGITQAHDPRAAAHEYRTAGWQAYVDTMSH